MTRFLSRWRRFSVELRGEVMISCETKDEAFEEQKLMAHDEAYVFEEWNFALPFDWHWIIRRECVR